MLTSSIRKIPDTVVQTSLRAPSAAAPTPTAELCTDPSLVQAHFLDAPAIRPSSAVDTPPPVLAWGRLLILGGAGLEEVLGLDGALGVSNVPIMSALCTTSSVRSKAGGC
mmetsp:Transcript_12852/g.36543  ORF Transcript_12852/g.36543 Transcript_12852/m.36543 type:complete len:110 (+) Transcript_12852:723-1052(+)